MIIRFVIYGLIGWCMEIIWTGIGSLLKKDFSLASNTSIWMFFIYGMAVFLEPVIDVVIVFPVILRGGIYAVCIFATEYLTGTIMRQLNVCPWDYSDAKYSVSSVIRLDYAPVWFAVGLIFEFVHINLL